MNYMRYDAATLGNHEFDNGLDTLAEVIKMAQFPIVCANYDFSGTVLEGIVKPYTVIKRKIGIEKLDLGYPALVIFVYCLALHCYYHKA